LLGLPPNSKEETVDTVAKEVDEVAFRDLSKEIFGALFSGSLD